jgi:hypothetical protein
MAGFSVRGETKNCEKLGSWALDVTSTERNRVNSTKLLIGTSINRCTKY